MSAFQEVFVVEHSQVGGDGGGDTTDPEFHEGSFSTVDRHLPISPPDNELRHQVVVVLRDSGPGPNPAINANTRSGGLLPLDHPARVGQVVAERVPLH